MAETTGRIRLRTLREAPAPSGEPTAPVLAVTELAQMELRRRKAELIEAADASRDTFTMFRRVRDRLLIVPHRISALCEGKPAAEIEALMAAEIRQALTELSEGTEA